MASEEEVVLPLLLLPLLLPLLVDPASLLVLNSSPVTVVVMVTVQADAATPRLASALLVPLLRRTTDLAVASAVLLPLPLLLRPLPLLLPLLLLLPRLLLPQLPALALNSSLAPARAILSALADAATLRPVLAPLVSLLRRTVAQAAALSASAGS